MPFPIPSSGHCQVNLTAPIQGSGWKVLSWRRASRHTNETRDPSATEWIIEISRFPSVLAVGADHIRIRWR
jgi:hypothetical protein